MEQNNFEGLVSQIQSAQEILQNNARLVINRHVTAKAWLTGYYIVEFEQHGIDRANYGERLLQNLAERLQDKKTFSYRSLKLYRQFYLTYPMLKVTIGNYIAANFPIWWFAKLCDSRIPTKTLRQTFIHTSVNHTTHQRSINACLLRNDGHSRNLECARASTSN